MYNDKVINEFRNPQNIGELESANAIGEAGNIVCGDILKIYMRIEGDIIQDISFQTFGCAAAIASSSMITQMVKGKSISYATGISNEDVSNALGGLPVHKLHCSVLAKEAIANALCNYFKKCGNKNCCKNI